MAPIDCSEAMDIFTTVNHQINDDKKQLQRKNSFLMPKIQQITTKQKNPSLATLGNNKNNNDCYVL